MYSVAACPDWDHGRCYEKEMLLVLGVLSCFALWIINILREGKSTSRCSQVAEQTCTVYWIKNDSWHHCGHCACPITGLKTALNQLVAWFHTCKKFIRSINKLISFYFLRREQLGRLGIVMILDMLGGKRLEIMGAGSCHSNHPLEN